MRTVAAALLVVGCAAPPALHEPPGEPPPELQPQAPPARAAPLQVTLEPEAGPSGPDPGAPPAPVPVIAGTDVPDTPENHAVLAVCERYRKALEARDAATLIALASPSYHDDGGTPDPADDLDHAGLKAYLQGMFGKARAVKYEIRYRQVARQGARIVVDFTYSAKFLMGDGARAKWHLKVSDNRIELEEQNGELLIVAGM